jgi:hypothetical protein
MKPLEDKTRFVDVTLTVLASVLLFSPNAYAQSSIEAVFPKNFDSKHQYTSYGYNDLLQHVKSSFQITNTFVGERIKVVARYDATPGWAALQSNALNRAKSPTPGHACNSDFCDRLEALLSESPDSGWQPFWQFFLYFHDPKSYATFVKAANETCTLHNPCYLLAAGTLKTTTVDVHRLLWTAHPDIVFLDSDKVALFKSSDNLGDKLILEGVLTGVKWGVKLYEGLTQ